jgi:hypothetical protein
MPRNVRRQNAIAKTLGNYVNRFHAFRKRSSELPAPLAKSAARAVQFSDDNANAHASGSLTLRLTYAARFHDR